MVTRATPSGHAGGALGISPSPRVTSPRPTPGSPSGWRPVPATGRPSRAAPPDPHPAPTPAGEPDHRGRGATTLAALELFPLRGQPLRRRERGRRGGTARPPARA